MVTKNMVVGESVYGEKRIAVADFKGKFLVIIFFKNNDSKDFLKAFSDLADLFRGNKIEVEAISKKILVG